MILRKQTCKWSQELNQKAEKEMFPLRNHQPRQSFFFFIFFLCTLFSFIGFLRISKCPSDQYESRILFLSPLSALYKSIHFSLSFSLSLINTHTHTHTNPLFSLIAFSLTHPQSLYLPYFHWFSLSLSLSLSLSSHLISHFSNSVNHSLIQSPFLSLDPPPFSYLSIYLSIYYPHSIFFSLLV